MQITLIILLKDLSSWTKGQIHLHRLSQISNWSVIVKMFCLDFNPQLNFPR